MRDSVYRYTIGVSTLSMTTTSVITTKTRTSVSKSSYTSRSLTRTTYSGLWSSLTTATQTSSSGFASLVSKYKTASTYTRTTSYTSTASGTGTASSTGSFIYSDYSITTMKFAKMTGNIISANFATATLSSARTIYSQRYTNRIANRTLRQTGSTYFSYPCVVYSTTGTYTLCPLLV